MRIGEPDRKKLASPALDEPGTSALSSSHTPDNINIECSSKRTFLCTQISGYQAQRSYMFGKTCGLHLPTASFQRRLMESRRGSFCIPGCKKSTTGEVLGETLLKGLEECNLEIKDLRGQGYDGSSAMSGKVLRLLGRNVARRQYMYTARHTALT
ncbi:hypothetical protein JTE90_016758 [Oedothorax gibbosus]|uniref:DUF4371 domain-containing protein n=1 Tax=Oedothorax gibbosus TaxID=931172 RepID=A0AAV6VZJ8_9ARAC|nr:hypothetical protein JTE90_016758 [Oedothorax gibbosus]